jgi:glycosyltransferase involved in cell wall biosynthesis
LESRFDVSHVYTSLGDWHYLQTLGGRPILLTTTESAARPCAGIRERVAHVVAESERLRDDAIAAGMPPDRVTVIYPGVDLARYRPAPPPPLPWKCLFASSPENEGEIQSKGVDLLLELARERPDLQITFLWRPFGKRSAQALKIVRAANLQNVTVVAGRVSNIEDYYLDHHFTIAPFRTRGKPCPNSILEGLACGRPALVSRTTKHFRLPPADVRRRTLISKTPSPLTGGCTSGSVRPARMGASGGAPSDEYRDLH